MPEEVSQQLPVDALPECPINILDFQRMFQDEISCLRYLEKIRWPGRFACKECGDINEPLRLATRPRVSIGIAI